jgi:hypothetical protein
MNYLKNKRVYVGGPIEHDDPRNDWRPEVKNTLVREFGLKVFDPAADPKQKLRERIASHKEKGEWDALAELVREFVNCDLGVVDRADFIVQHLPYRVPTTGTHHEIIFSNESKKPTLLVCPQGKKCIPDWYFGFINHEHMFGPWDDLFEYLRAVDKGEKIGDKRWFFVYRYTDLAWLA